MKTAWIGLAALVVTAVGAVGHADDKEISGLMHKKLVASQQVLEGIVVNDFNKIDKGATDLIAVSKAAEWKVLRTPEYETYSNDFRRLAEALIRNAKEKNNDGAVQAYADMTRTCVQCHKHVREIRMARAE
jgi:hypothetical protein